MKKTLLLSTLLLASVTTVTFAQEVTTGATTDTGTVITTSGTVADTGVVTTGVVATGVVSTGVVSTGVVTTGTTQSGVELGKFIRTKKRGGFYENFGYVWSFIKRPLKGAELTQVKTIVNEKNAAIKAINKEINTIVRSKTGTVDRAMYKGKVVETYTKFRTEITPFIAPKKLDKFNKYMDTRLGLIEGKLGIKKEVVKVKAEIKQKKEEVKKAIKSEKKEINKKLNQGSGATQSGSTAEREDD